MEEIRKIVHELRATPELVKIHSGFLIKDILERTAKKIQGTLQPANLKLYMYSAHSSIISNILNGFFGFAEVFVKHKIVFDKKSDWVD